MKTLALLLFATLPASLASAQYVSISDVQNIVSLALSSPVLLQTVTGIDGTVCTLYKVPGPTISGSFTCALGSVSLRPALYQGTGTVSTFQVLGQGKALCLVGINPTAASVSYGSIGIASATGIAWNCEGGAGSPILSGTAVWP